MPAVVDMLLRGPSAAAVHPRNKAAVQPTERQGTPVQRLPGLVSLPSGAQRAMCQGAGCCDPLESSSAGAAAAPTPYPNSSQAPRHLSCAAGCSVTQIPTVLQQICSAQPLWSEARSQALAQ
jgi:hypothetical protein